MREIEWLLIDGYNLLFQWCKNYEHLKNKENAREDLIQKLIEYSGYHSMRTIIIFDGQGAQADQNTRSEFFQILYTASGETADEWIEKKNFELLKEGWITKVVTSDYLEQQIVFGSGALRIPVREMILEMKQLRKEIKKIEESQSEILKRREISKSLDQEVMKKLNDIRFARHKD